MTTMVRLALLAVLLSIPLGAAGADEEAPPSGPPLPSPAPGRVVVADARVLVFEARERERTLRDFDAEESDVIAQINRSPSTWQSYLLYTQEDLPEKLFHPGFTLVLDRPKAPTPAPAGRVPAPPQAAPAPPVAPGN